MGKAQVFHVAGKIAFPDFASQARIEPSLLADAGDRQTAIIVCGVEQAQIRQGEDLFVDRAVHRVRIALLEIGPSGASDKETVPGERHAAVVED